MTKQKFQIAIRRYRIIFSLKVQNLVLLIAPNSKQLFSLHTIESRKYNERNLFIKEANWPHNIHIQTILFFHFILFHFFTLIQAFLLKLMDNKCIPGVLNKNIRNIGVYIAIVENILGILEVR